MIELNLNPSLLDPDNARPSSFAYIVNAPEVEAKLARIFRRRGLCLKVSRQPLKEGLTAETATWGRAPLLDLSRIQNIYAWHGLAPRVYALGLLNDEYAAQVVEFDRDEGKANIPAILSLAQRYGVKSRKNWDVGPRNWIGGHLVDFSGLYFEDWEWTLGQLVIEAYTRRGKNIGSAYQSVPGLGIRGQRDMQHRLSVVGLDAVDFAGKIVLDLGCNLGAFCRYSARRGAARVVGVDRVTARQAYEVANWLGHWNIDYLDLSLPDEIEAIEAATGLGQFDIVFANAIVNHVNGYAPWLAGLVKPGGLLYFEGHGKVERGIYTAGLERDFGEVTKLGETTDNYQREVFRCRKRTSRSQ